MTKSVWDRVLGLAWLVYGSIELSRALYLFFHIRALARGGDPWDFIRISPFWLVLALIVIGGAGMAFGRRWAWITTLVLSLLYSAFSAINVHGLAYTWARYHPAVGEVTSLLLPFIVFWALTVWTVVRFFSRQRPWQSVATG